MKKYLVGGAVRDKLMGKTPKDFDYSVVLEGNEDALVMRDGEIQLFRTMKAQLEFEGFRIFLESPEHFTIRAQFPKSSGQRLTADFVLARKEGPYTDGRHPDWVERGTILDDLKRRDFTMNAIAEAEDGSIFDPFDGQRDINDRVINAVGSAKERMMEDALRVLRAMRFGIQLRFGFTSDVLDAMYDLEVTAALRNNIADERKMDEVNKMFRIDTIETLKALERFYLLRNAIFRGGRVNLEATMKQKGFSGAGGKQKKVSNLPPAYNNCQCNCHTEKGVMHMSACCRPGKESK